MATSDSTEKKAHTEEAEEGDHGGLLDQPLVVEGKRRRKSTETFAIKHEAKRPVVKYEGGSGAQLGDIARVEHFISKQFAVDLKPLHRLCFDRPGTKTEIKKNLREFSGFAFKRDSEEFKKKKAALDKLTKSGLRIFLEVLDLPRSGSKEEQIDCILAFLLEPQDSGKPVPKPKRRKRSSSGRQGKRSGHAKKAKRSASSTSDTEEEEMMALEMEMEKEEEEEEEEEGEEEEEEERKGEEEVDVESSVPTDEELYSTVEGLLKEADLETITTNSVCQQVFTRYSGQDLSGRKEYLKNCIEKILRAS